MVIQSDIILKGNEWRTAIQACSMLFTQRVRYDVFLMATTIGVLYDRRIDALADDELSDTTPSVPRNVFNNNSEVFDELFQTAILTTTTVDLPDEMRLDLAFGEGDGTFDKRAFLISFANFGITKFVTLLSNDEIETAENIKNFVTRTLEGSNFDLDPIVLDEEIPPEFL